MATASIPVGYQDDELDNQELPEELQNALRSLVQHVLGLEKWPRRQEVMLARLQRFYERGDQHVYWDARSWVFAQVTGGASVQTDDGSVDMPHYVADYNIFGPYERSLVAVLSQNPPGVNFEPNDPNKAVDIASAKAAERFRHYVDRCNPRKNLQSSIVRLFCTDGRVVLWTRNEKSAAHFGYNDAQEPNEGELLSAYGVLESKVPLTLSSIQDFPYAAINFEIDINVAKHEYDFAATKIQQGSGSLGESSYERFARLGVLQGTRSLTQIAEQFKHLVTKNNVWLRPCMFRQVDDASRKELERIFPQGVKTTFVGGAYCGACSETMDDHLAVAHPLPGDGQNRPSMMKAMIAIQDSFNDLMNLSKEIYDYCVPSTWVDERAVDPEALREMVSEPGVYRSFKGPQNMKGSDCFYTEQLEHVPSDMQNALDNLSGQLSQFITGALPALFGGELEGNDTASGYAMAREQAMGQMSLPWGALQELMAEGYKQAVKCAAKHRPQDEILNVQVPGKKSATVEQVAVQDLASGDFHARPDTDSSFPETTAGKRAAVMALITEAATTPELAMTLWEPKNQELIKEWLGVEDLVILGAESYEKQLIEIEQLLSTQPVPPSPEELQQFQQQVAGAQQAMAQGTDPGAPPANIPGPKPSVPVDPVFDMHNYEFKACQDWLNSSERREQEANGNVAGVENVRLHAIEHQKFMAMMAPPPAPAPSGPQEAAPEPPGGNPASGVPPTQGLQ